MVFDCPRVDVRSSTAAADLAAILSEHGIALLERVPDRDALLRLARSIAVVVPHPDSGPDGVTMISDRYGVAARPGFGAFGSGALLPHTDRAGVPNPPALLMMACMQLAISGGESVVVDSRAVYDDLAAAQPDALKVLSEPRCVQFGGAGGHLGSVFTHSVGGWIAVRLRLDELARFSPKSTPWLPTLRAAIQRQSIRLRLEPHQGYVLHNHRWLHGRDAFIGQRVMYRLHGNPLPALQMPLGFHPSISLPPRIEHLASYEHESRCHRLADCSPATGATRPYPAPSTTAASIRTGALVR